MLSLLLAVPSCIYSFGTVSSLHPTSFLMIFTLVSLSFFYPGLALTVVRGEIPYVVSRATLSVQVRACVVCWKL